MSIVSVKPLHDRRRSSYRDAKTTHSLLWLVTSDTAADGPAAAMFASGIPVPGSVFVDVAGQTAPLTGIDCDPRNGSDRHFEVMVTFETGSLEQPDENPLTAPWGYSFSYTDTTEPYFIDRSDPAGDTGTANKAVVNSAQEPFEQYQQRERGELTVTITRNVSSHNAAALDQYSHTVNPAVVTIDGNNFAAGTCKLSPIGAVKSRKVMKDKTVVVYYAQTIQLKARHQGWHDRPLDIGFNELIGDKTKNTQTLRPIVGSNNQPLTKPWPLDGSGGRKPNISDPPFVLDFQPYFGHLDWGPLNLQ